jgi:glycosyltransferase involved in cell wall biosynthesis
MTQISVVVPVFNEEESLPELTQWINRVMQANAYTYEVLLINDGSTDRSWEVIQELSASNTALKGINFTRNYGKSAALDAGFKRCSGEVVITMDADLQDSPDEIPALYEMIVQQDYDVVSGWKKKRHDLILLDYMLPGRKGDEVLSEIMDVDKNQPIIVMTAFDKPEYNKDFILNGASQYLPKPYTLMELRAQCVSQINKAKLIYQDYYHDQKQKKLRNLVNELERELTVSNIEKARRIIDAIKINLPHSLSEDEQARTWNSVF